MRRGGNESVPFELSIVNLLDDPTVRGLVVSGHDITQLRATRDASRRAHDVRPPRRGLANRVTLRAHVERCLGNPTTAVVFIDLNGFRPSTTSTAGPPATRSCGAWRRASSRRCAKATSWRATAGTSSSSSPPSATPRSCGRLAARLAEGIQRPIELPEGTFRLTASVGLAHPGPGDTAATLARPGRHRHVHRQAARRRRRELPPEQPRDAERRHEPHSCSPRRSRPARS